MKATQISKENGVVKFNIEFSAEEWKDAIDKAYKANRNKFSIDGFRKGKAPRKIIENFYGHDIFWDEALNGLLETGYSDAIKEMDIEVIAQPSFESPEIKKDEPVMKLAEKVYAKYPELVEAMRTRARRYNECTAELEKLRLQGKVLVFTPKTTYGISRTESDPEDLMRLYSYGERHARHAMEQLKKYISRPHI